ncbi:hypothetical protein AAFF_G00107120 [Aldrovandia affinis]|uniref:Uncharacterized protein n=1 Tax=Aldrovandia affinis TaxID=143900 RepID=A0AAD7WXY3_9TELE|nr:hypothetical protein AAFF_G00107120 [Aldrovandia affinis]
MPQWFSKGSWQESRLTFTSYRVYPVAQICSASGPFKGRESALMSEREDMRGDTASSNLIITLHDWLSGVPLTEVGGVGRA